MKNNNGLRELSLDEINAVSGGLEGNFTAGIKSVFGSPSGDELDFISGFTFLQRYYSVYDSVNLKVDAGIK